ncbi:BZ3500_MvSof-1268-A1-R1_Chr5-2g07766 [Microbotryum saponariae]|uniref:BZ3500_MvSof-1268-A1-R1_Chr5-2g07766 protein n=1 Tax=Microbotryum saponariae TaxID=289078 RepID=A0A2X0M8Y2_9BASI|nr:BZ3500_MvSof-1268-A1-R1_Chr5-2g07766 [Microbotryum saponariae]SDA05635.1 BZ3501_MvSof-1269-A2-R1_Chr5-2g07588 [Microbotryum saponariae]
MACAYRRAERGNQDVQWTSKTSAYQNKFADCRNQHTRWSRSCYGGDPLSQQCVRAPERMFKFGR